MVETHKDLEMTDKETMMLALLENCDAKENGHSCRKKVEKESSKSGDMLRRKMNESSQCGESIRNEDKRDDDYNDSSGNEDNDDYRSSDKN